jgi:hypothetical protein
LEDRLDVDMREDLDEHVVVEAVEGGHGTLLEEISDAQLLEADLAMPRAANQNFKDCFKHRIAARWADLLLFCWP